MRHRITSCVGVAVLTLSANADAALSPEEQATVAKLKASVAEASNLYQEEKDTECRESLVQVIEQLNKLSSSGSAELLSSLKYTHARAKRASRLLEREGLELPDLLPLGAGAPPAQKPPTPALTKEVLAAVSDAKAALANAAALYKRKAYEECGKAVAVSIKTLNSLSKSDNENLLNSIRITHTRTTKARLLLVQQSIDLPELKPLAQVKTTPKQTTPKQTTPKQTTAKQTTAGARTEKKASGPGDEAEPTSSQEARSVSFVRQIAPMLLQKCSGCHIRGQKGEFSMVSFASLRKGGESGQHAIEPGKPGESYLFELVEAGDMPPRGELTKAEVQTLRDWIAAGALYDGNDEAEALANLRPEAMRDRPGQRGDEGFDRGPPRRGER